MSAYSHKRTLVAALVLPLPAIMFCHSGDATKGGPMAAAIFIFTILTLSVVFVRIGAIALRPKGFMFTLKPVGHSTNPVTY
jgi:hypothetical protein